MSTAIAPMRPDLAAQWRQRKLEQLQSEWLKRVLYGTATAQDRAAMAAIATAAGVDPELLFAGTGEPGHDPRTGPVNDRAVHDPQVRIYTSEDPANWHAPAEDADSDDEVPEETDDVASDLVEIAYRDPAKATRLARRMRSHLSRSAVAGLDATPISPCVRSHREVAPALEPLEPSAA
ncbi:hypothetical protein CLV63_14124 [Murinocardiopsis flavida]|uniref:Uncharacterized protein n=1 Tax=Murinocardiopsis flavida TaxID=645275 RepID=A0A2P8CDJ1_9ACTN|nr:hypothetical protein [Murinocardiopsis flavida]PSK83058.1 hypothetical protein CLV63_14124 [Murinocardiopsis flavida]